MSLREADRKRESERIAFLFSLPVAWTVKLKNEMNVTEREKEGEERERERAGMSANSPKAERE